MSEWLKEQFYASRALQYPYRSWMDIQSRVAEFRSRPFAAASRLLQIWRQMGTDDFGSERAARLMKVVREHCYDRDKLLPAAENGLRLDFIHSRQAKEIRKVFAAFSLEDRARLRFPNDEDPERQGDLIVLKSFDAKSGERGVLLIKYSEAILAMAAVYDLGALASRYLLVLEPSQWGYQDARFLNYLGCDLEVLVGSPRRPDFEFIESLRTNLVPIDVGSGDWGDPALFLPRATGKPASCDVVMVAAWDPLKRHEVFFAAAARLKRQHEQRLRFALIGYDLGWTRAQIEQLLRQYSLEDQCEIFENIPHAQVARIVADSKVSLLLSQREGSNKSIYESMFCGTPVIVYRRQCGINLAHINPRTGLLAEDDELADAIRHVLTNPQEFDPRGWAMANVGYPNSSRKINAALSNMSHARARPWTRDIVAKKNGPNLRYAEAGRYQEFAPEYERLSEFLLPVD